MNDTSVQELSAHQERVHSMIQSVGGYWRPINGLARLLEELGELSERIGHLGGRKGHDRLAEEFADVWIITACTANQFNINLSRQKILGDVSPGGIERLLVRAGLIARILNYYDGPKTPRSTGDWPSLGEAIASFHAELSALAVHFKVDLNAAVEDKIKVTPQRDIGRFKRSYDPSTSEVLSAFESFRHKSMCTFADQAKLWGAPRWRDDQPLEQNVERLIPYFTIFAKAAEREGLDGFVVAPSPQVESEGMAGLAAWFADFLTLLVKSDISRSCDDDAFAGVDRSGWQFTFCGVRMFVSVFSSLYAPRHPRSARTGPYVVFQPESSFDAHRIGSDHTSSKAAKERIRRQFAEAGFEYPDELIDQRIEAQIYLLPRWKDDAATMWWWNLQGYQGSA